MDFHTQIHRWLLPPISQPDVGLIDEWEPCIDQWQSSWYWGATLDGMETLANNGGGMVLVQGSNGDFIRYSTRHLGWVRYVSCYSAWHCLI